MNERSSAFILYAYDVYPPVDHEMEFGKGLSSSTDKPKLLNVDRSFTVLCLTILSAFLSITITSVILCA